MTTQTTNTFPEFNNTAFIEGTVYKSTIQLQEFTDAKTKNKYNALSGRLIVRTGENESHTVQYFVKEFTKTGKENGIFKNVQTVLDELMTIEDISDTRITTPEGAEPSRVRVRGEVDLNEYYNDADKLSSQLQIKGVFLNRVKPEDEFNPRAEFDVEGIVIKNIGEVVDDEETGRRKVTLLIPTYNNALPVEFVSRAEDGGYIEDNFETGTSVNLYGKIVNFSKRTEVKIEAGFGEDKTEVKYENTREVQITGGKVYDEESDKAITQEQFKELQARRNTALAVIKEKSDKRKAEKEKKGGTGNKPTGFGGNSASTGGGATNRPKVDVSGMF